MSNDWFEFKQFRIEQGQTAMKVGTDGVLLGAWTEIDNCKTVLDIGTGTGLIALMLAQRNPLAQITGVEIDKQASQQAQANFSNSKWSPRLRIENTTIQSFAKHSQKQFDAIVSNPPFFRNGYASPHKQRQLARQNDSLSFDDLLQAVQKLLNKTGTFSVIIPMENKDEFIEKAEQKHLYIIRCTEIYPTNKSEKAKRVLLSFSKIKHKVENSKLVIEPEQRHQYSKEYIALTQDFYLKF